MDSTRARLVRDVFAALWLSVLAGIAAALTLALIVVAFASIAHGQTSHDELDVKLGEDQPRQIVLEDPSPRTLSPPR